MLLAIDVGNSHSVVGCFQDTKILKTWRINTRPFCTGDELRLKIESFLSRENLKTSDFQSIVASSVVPQMSQVLRSAFQDLDFRLIDCEWPFSFEIAAHPASSVGADRLVNAEAAVRDHGAPCIIVDSGTATTLCAVQAPTSGRKPVYLGGAIMPGIELSMEALASKTAQLFSVELAAPKSAIGGNTAAAIQSGILLGYAEMVDGMIKRFKAEMRATHAKVIATGGVSRLLNGVTKNIEIFDTDLTLRGIQYLYASIRAR